MGEHIEQRQRFILGPFRGLTGEGKNDDEPGKTYRSKGQSKKGERLFPPPFMTSIRISAYIPEKHGGL